MGLNNSINNSCFSAIFDPSDPCENYHGKKKNLYKERILVAVSSPCVNAQIAKLVFINDKKRVQNSDKQLR